MKLNLVVWREALVRFESQLKSLKAEARRRRSQEEKFDFDALFLAKAEVTRLYCLRRAAKGQLHASGRLRRICKHQVDLFTVVDLATQDELLRSAPGWLESFLI